MSSNTKISSANTGVYTYTSPALTDENSEAVLFSVSIFHVTGSSICFVEATVLALNAVLPLLPEAEEPPADVVSPVVAVLLVVPVVPVLPDELVSSLSLCWEILKACDSLWAEVDSVPDAPVEGCVEFWSDVVV